MTGEPQLPLFAAAAPSAGAARRVVLSYGLGVDSTALLVRWLLDPSSRNFELEDLVVVTAMTGDEHSITGELVQRHVLPLLAAHGVRYAQVARASGSQTDGITVLSDTTTPDEVHLRGAFKLSDELTAAGTVPQAGGARLCSAKAKGAPLDAWIASALGTQPYRHAIGFESTETRRAERDARFNTGQRTGIYPLIDWNWDRQACLDYIERTLGVSNWPKSCCTYCVYALATQDGRRRMFDAYDQEPAAGVQALMLNASPSL